MRRFPVHAVLALHLLAAGALAAQTAAGPRVDSVPGERWIGPEGHRVHARVEGTGSPTVVLISGLGDGMGSWDDVEPAMRRMTRVVSYDRPGLGASDPGTAPRTVGRMVTELRDMLRTLGIRPPYVLCGHSLGGSVAQVYAGRYPNEVAALLLVDPASDDFFAQARATVPGYAERRAERVRQSESWPAGIHAELVALDSSMAETRHMGPMPDVPITMLIAGRHGPPPGTSLDSLRANPIERIWRQTHIAWIEAQPRGHYVFDETSGHYIQREDPTVVLDALRDLLGEIGG